MKNIDVIKAFYNGEPAMTNNLKSHHSGIIYHYSTVIAVISKGTLYLNTQKYSQTTSTIQNMIRRESPYNVVEYDNELDVIDVYTGRFAQ